MNLFSVRFPAAPNSTSPVDFIANVGWGAIKTLSSMDEFRNLDRDIENNSKRWRKFIEGESPEKDKFPQVRSDQISEQNLKISGTISRVFLQRQIWIVNYYIKI